ncbi:hypothetical protein K402DRAFT_395995 [Aulographum hederae CBS 113979]|uniref:Uncharacterized protein n=1 Tax=Aulographum hederae CBS 113979 TaxID=1176131 RepID=A0A6G1GSZ0_9PEZI|nr:hypothetical protein K402DRAFT_395995 [Aulographum hederae CBS 113979]
MSMDKVSKNLDDLERKLTKSNKIVAKGEKLSLSDAIKLGQKSNAMTSTIRKGIKEYDGTTPSDAESAKILEKMIKIVDLTETQLDLLVKNKAQFEKLHVGGLVKKNMAKTGEASVDLSKMMLEKAPQSLKGEAEGLEKRRAKKFDEATAAFAGSTGGEDQAEGEDDSD